MRKRRAAFFAGKSCENCGATERLELHHRNPAQKTSSRIWSWSKPRREAELAKCSVLCHSCHAEETRQQRVRASKYGNPLPGVTFEALRKQWQVRDIGGNRKFRGYFKTAEEAALVAQNIPASAIRPGA